MNKNKFGDLKNIFMIAAVATGLSACIPEDTNPPAGSSDSSSSQSSDPVTGPNPPVVGTGLADVKDWFVELPDGRGGVAVEPIAYTPEMGFDKAVSQKAFEETLYPVLRNGGCAGCHSTENKSASGAQAPLHSDVDPQLAHEYALTRVNFREPEESKIAIRLYIDRHNCFGSSCAAAGQQIIDAIKDWKGSIQHMLLDVEHTVDPGTTISEDEVLAWIDADKNATSAADREFIKYASFHVLHNDGTSAQNMNHARVGLSKALNSLARWAPEVVNPVDVNGKGIVYRFDIRDYWGHTKVDTSSSNYALFYGGSDDDLAFAQGKLDASGNPVNFNSLGQMQNRMRSSVQRDDKFARLAWQRILQGNVEGADDRATLPPNIDGFVGKRSTGPTNQPYIKSEDFVYAEAAQLAYTLTRPDVYNAIMAIPGYSHWLEDELGVDKSNGVDSYEIMITYEAITIDSRLWWRAKQNTGRGDYYWKTFDTFATGQTDIDEMYRNEQQNSPFWEAPVPVFISAGGGGGTTPDKLAIIATRNLGPGGQNGGGFYTGTDSGSQFGGQQSAEELIWSMPNGLQAYALYGGFNQRRVDAFTNIVRDPRILRDTEDHILDNYTGFGFPRGSEQGTKPGIRDVRLNNGSSCIGCHVDGMNRSNNDLRDWLDEDRDRLPRGDHGVDKWINDSSYVSRVKDLFPPSSTMRERMENDRRTFLDAMGEIKKGMIIGPDKNIYLEPTIWMIEWAREHYDFPVTRSS